MARKRKKKVDTWKTKKWHTLLAPSCFDEKELGETLTSEKGSLVGRTIKISLGEITEKRSQQHIGLIFKVYKVEGEKAYTEIKGHEIQRGYIGRLSKRMKSVVRAIFDVKTKDGKILQVQTLCLARVGMNKNQEKAVRKEMEDIVKNKANKSTLDKFFQEIVFGKLSSEIFSRVKKIFPVMRVEVTKTKVKSEKE